MTKTTQMRGAIVRTICTVFCLLGLFSPAVFAEPPEGVKALLTTASLADNEKAFNTVLQTALETWPNDRVAILTLARSLQSDWMSEGAIAEIEAAAQEAEAAQQALENRGLYHYVDPALWNVKAELGARQSSGDSDEQAIAFGLSFNRNFGDKWEHSFKFNADFTRAGGATTRERFLSKYEALWKAWDKGFLVNYTEVEVDRFSGRDFRITENIGIGYQLLDGKVHKLRFEGGPGVRFNKIEATELTPSETENEFIGRIASLYELKIAENILVTDRASILFGTNSTTFDNLLEISSRLNSRLAARLSFGATYDSAPPPGTTAWDTLTRATLVFDF